MVLLFTTKNSPALIRFFQILFPPLRPSPPLKRHLLTQVLLDLAGHFCYHNVVARATRRYSPTPLKRENRHDAAGRRVTKKTIINRRVSLFYYGFLLDFQYIREENHRLAEVGVRLDCPDKTDFFINKFTQIHIRSRAGRPGVT